MSLPANRHIAVLGAPGSGAEPLAQALRQALPDLQITEQLHSAEQPPQLVLPDLALVMGLDAGATPPDMALLATLERIDTDIRHQLLTLGVPYRVVYGRDAPARFSQALLALGLSPTDPAALAVREQAQYQLNRGRTPWSCETCSDPDCEHRLFTGLLSKRS